MNDIAPTKVANNIVLKRISANCSLLAPKVPLIRSAYIKYNSHTGRPLDIQPIGLNESESSKLESIYEGETKKYAASWIGHYRSAPDQTYCPLCGSPNPSQLEHYLPKKHYPEFTVLSWNLVPTCSICNPKRGHHAHAPKEPVPLVHPYYERDLLKHPLFSAEILRPFAAVRFTPVVNPSTSDPELIARLKRQIRLCFNKDIFNRWLVNKLWKEAHADLSGLTAQSQAVAKIARSLKIRVATTGMNSWDTIFFRALSADEEAVQWLRETPSPILL